MLIFCKVVVASVAVGQLVGVRLVSDAEAGACGRAVAAVRSVVYIVSLKSTGGAGARACTYYDVMNGDILAAFDFTCKASSSVPFVI